jgi:outer membrane immunogenic protein
VRSTSDCPAAGGYFCNGGSNVAAINTDGSGSLNANGFTGGAQAGYNWQKGSLVYGLELDLSAFRLDASRSAGRHYSGQTLSYVINTSIDTDWLSTTRLRLGWASYNALVYVTGGLALTTLQVSNSFVDTNTTPATGASHSSDMKTGLALGGGFEWAVDRNWILRGEYLFLDFGSVTTNATIIHTPTASSNQISTSGDLSAHIVRAGLSYKF